MGGCDSCARGGGDFSLLSISLDKVLALANTGDLIFYGEPGHWNEVAMLLRYKGKDDKPDELILFELRGVNYAGDRLKDVMENGRGAWDNMQQPDPQGAPRIGFRQLMSPANETQAEGLQETVRLLMSGGNMSLEELKNEIETQTGHSLPANLTQPQLIDTLSAELVLILARREEMVPLMSPEPDVVRFHTANDFLPMSEHPVALVEPYSFGPLQIISAPVGTTVIASSPLQQQRTDVSVPIGQEVDTASVKKEGGGRKIQDFTQYTQTHEKPIGDNGCVKDICNIM